MIWTQSSSHIVDEDNQVDDADQDDAQKDENDDYAYIVGHRAISLLWTHGSSHIAGHYGAEDEDKYDDCAHFVGYEAGRMSVFLCCVMPEDLTMMKSKLSISSSNLNRIIHMMMTLILLMLIMI